LKAREGKRIIRGVSEETTQHLPQDGVRLILARLDSIDSRLTALEVKVDLWLGGVSPYVGIRLGELETERTQ
jgi:hypothetical protein